MTAKDAAKLRQRMKLTQLEFAALLGKSVLTIRDWEQGLATPSPAASELLRLVQESLMMPEDAGAVASFFTNSC